MREISEQSALAYCIDGLVFQHWISRFWDRKDVDADADTFACTWRTPDRPRCDHAPRCVVAGPTRNHRGARGGVRLPDLGDAAGQPLLGRAVPEPGLLAGVVHRQLGPRLAADRRLPWLVRRVAVVVARVLAGLAGDPHP